MISIQPLPPLGLYIHLPWCVQKCPYCDFNSHQLKDKLPEELYVQALLRELNTYAELVQGRELISIFFGGGTPSLFSGKSIKQIVEGAAQRIAFAKDIEITMEANPGTVDQVNFVDYRTAGVNRLSLGIQSLQNDKLKTLGRIHDSDNALKAIDIAKQAGFTNFNLDIMYGLPNQSLYDALSDIEMALSCEPSHFSWYQLTLEPNTLFYHQPPPLPADDNIYEMQLAGQDLIRSFNFNQYEVSAYAKEGKECRHNRNYWEFGDYLGIGAGAHSKISIIENQTIVRFSQVKHPRDYLNPALQMPTQTMLSASDLVFEFMLNALRLTNGTPITHFSERTGLSLSHIEQTLKIAKQRKLLLEHDSQIIPSELGKQFLNDLVALFLADNQTK